MKVFVGECRGVDFLRIVRREGMGRMFVHQIKPSIDPLDLYALDNDAFRPWLRAGKPLGMSAKMWLKLWDSKRFEKRVNVAEKFLHDPYFSVCPDIPGAGLASLRFSLEWRMDLMNSFPWYLAVQDGMTEKDVIPHLHLFSGIFLGGSDSFKGTAIRWCRLAHQFQKKFHYARAGTLNKVKHAYMVGADSCDSSFPLWTRQRMREFVAHVGGLRVQNCFSAFEVAS